MRWTREGFIPIVCAPQVSRARIGTNTSWLESLHEQSVNADKSVGSGGGEQQACGMLDELTLWQSARKLP